MKFRGYYRSAHQLFIPIILSRFSGDLCSCFWKSTLGLGTSWALGNPTWLPETRKLKSGFWETKLGVCESKVW